LGGIIMHLSFEQKEEIIDSHEQLLKYDISNGRINYKYNGRVIIKELNRKTGNGYICGKFLEENKYDVNSRGWINIKHFNRIQLTDLLEEVMISFLIYL
jgi:hypothetical protein